MLAHFLRCFTCLLVSRFYTCSVVYSTTDLLCMAHAASPCILASLNSTCLLPRRRSMLCIYVMVKCVAQDHTNQVDGAFSSADAAVTGTGWTFSPCTVDAFISTLGQALDTYRNHPDSFKDLQSRGMVRDSSWDKAAQEYEQIFEWAKVDEPYCR